MPYLWGSPSGTIFLPDAHHSATESHGVRAAGLLHDALLPLTLSKEEEGQGWVQG